MKEIYQTLGEVLRPQTNGLTMQQILDRLTEWKENIDCDIKMDYTEPDKRYEYVRQSIVLAQCIGMLRELGNNNNI